MSTTTNKPDSEQVSSDDVVIRDSHGDLQQSPSTSTSHSGWRSVLDTLRRNVRKTLAPAAAVLIVATIPVTKVQGEEARSDQVLRVGFQKYGTLVILKSKGTLEKRLEPLGVKVQWTEFPAGPQLLEGLNVGSIDFGVTGEAPPIIAQAAGADLVYVANEPPAPKGEAILVPKDSPLKTVADLKGKRVGLNKGSNVHYLLIKALEKAGLKYTDIEVAFLPPADGRAAFEKGSLDAWVVWDPFYAAAEDQIGARKLADGEGIVANTQFYLASRKYAADHANIINALVEEVGKIDQLTASNPTEIAGILAPNVGLPVPTVEKALRRAGFGVQPIGADIAAQQQNIADTFFSLKLIPKEIKISDVLWKPAK
ncbi:MAG TPA: sulfonate ABC transporter substrate-binding protein [Pseudomonadales bacterium]|nr:sulfonate ABC transporter substrate-binding protein [Pseudomonadales bacterium]